MKKEVMDKHGYVINGLPAKSKKSEIKALQDHLHWLEMKHIEVTHEIKDKLNELKND